MAGGDKGIVEAPTEPRWSPQGKCIWVHVAEVVGIALTFLVLS